MRIIYFEGFNNDSIVLFELTFTKNEINNANNNTYIKLLKPQFQKGDIEQIMLFVGNDN